MLTGEPAVENRSAYAATPELMAELEYTDDEVEDAEHAAMVLASVAGLASYGERVVVVAEVDSSLVQPAEDSANGEVLLSRCPASSMIAWFAEEPGVDVADAAAISKSMTIDMAWGQPQVQALLENHDLLWNDKVEYQKGS